MSVFVKVCVGVVSAALLTSPGVALAGGSSASGATSGGKVHELSVRDYELHQRMERQRNSVTAVSDLPPFRLGSIEQERRRGIDGQVRPYLSPGKKLGVKKQKLPDQCLRIVETRRGDRLAYSARCLQRQYRHASKLPRDCRVAVRGWRDTTVVYGAHCLANDGWRVARR